MIDLRRVRVGIEVRGQINWYEGLRVTASGTKYASAMQNECAVTIDGLSRDVRDYILTRTTPYTIQREPYRLILEVGRVSTGVHRIFTGDIISSAISEPPDVRLSIKAKTGAWRSGQVIADAGPPMEALSSVAARVAAHTGTALEFEATEKNIASFTYSGGAIGMVDALQQAGGVKAFIDDEVLYVRDTAAPIRGRHRILSAQTGMVGIPRPTTRGVDVTYLIDGQSSVGGSLTVESRLNPSLNGTYIIEQLTFEVASHDDPFFYTAICASRSRSLQV